MARVICPMQANQMKGGRFWTVFFSPTFLYLSVESQLGGGFKYFCLHLYLGKRFPFGLIFFTLGWNHQLEMQAFSIFHVFFLPKLCLKGSETLLKNPKCTYQYLSILNVSKLHLTDSKNRGGPPKWKTLLIHGWFGGTTILGTPQTNIIYVILCPTERPFCAYRKLYQFVIDQHWTNLTCACNTQWYHYVIYSTYTVQYYVQIFSRATSCSFFGCSEISKSRFHHQICITPSILSFTWGWSSSDKLTCSLCYTHTLRYAYTVHQCHSTKQRWVTSYPYTRKGQSTTLGDAVTLLWMASTYHQGMPRSYGSKPLALNWWGWVSCDRSWNHSWLNWN